MKLKREALSCPNCGHNGSGIQPNHPKLSIPKLTDRLESGFRARSRKCDECGELYETIEITVSEAYMLVDTGGARSHVQDIRAAGNMLLDMADQLDEENTPQTEDTPKKGTLAEGQWDKNFCAFPQGRDGIEVTRTEFIPFQKQAP